MKKKNCVKLVKGELDILFWVVVTMVARSSCAYSRGRRAEQGTTVYGAQEAEETEAVPEQDDGDPPDVVRVRPLRPNLQSANNH